MIQIPSTLATALQQYTKQAAEARTAVCKSFEVSDIELAIVLLVANREDLRMKDIGGFIGMKLSSLTGTIDYLESLKLVKRRNDKEDRRVVFVRLATRGQALIDALDEPFSIHAEHLASKLSAEEIATLEKAFALLAASAE